MKRWKGGRMEEWKNGRMEEDLPPCPPCGFFPVAREVVKI
jgi:hypothetical protein